MPEAMQHNYAGRIKLAIQIMYASIYVFRVKLSVLEFRKYSDNKLHITHCRLAHVMEASDGLLVSKSRENNSAAPKFLSDTFLLPPPICTLIYYAQYMDVTHTHTQCILHTHIHKHAHYYTIIITYLNTLGPWK